MSSGPSSHWAEWTGARAQEARSGKVALVCILAWKCRVFWQIAHECVFVSEQASSHSLWRESRLLETNAGGNRQSACRAGPIHQEII